MATIYSTLGLARSLAGVLRDRGLLDGAFVLGFLLIFVAIILVRVKKWPNLFQIGVGVAITAVYLMTFARMGIPEERTHLFEYSVVGLFIFEALTERHNNGRRVPIPAVLAVVMTALLGLVDEGIQWVLPTRYFDWIDVGFNALAGVMAVGGSMALNWAGRWGPRLFSR